MRFASHIPSSSDDDNIFSRLKKINSKRSDNPIRTNKRSTVDQHITNKGKPTRMSGAERAFGMNRDGAETEEEGPTFK